YAWDLQHQYLQESGMERSVKGWIARAALHYVRMWDQRTANGVDYFVANSGFIARRIAKAYGRDAQVIYPPVDTQGFTLQEAKKPFFLTASRMVPYKRVPLIVEAFAGMPQHELVVIGDGAEYERVKSLATPNVKVLGYQSSDVLRSYMRDAQAFVFAAEEDFGITLVEAQASGTPVIAFGRGGAREIIRSVEASDAPTGLFFEEQTVTAIQDAVQRFEQQRVQLTPAHCRANAERFSTARFASEVRALVDSAWATHQRSGLGEHAQAEGSSAAVSRLPRRAR
ncbi:MAG: glycosyl transferase family 1, partial [Myxococcaceae bacterium]|nr:glycosyl transferase family 1 [Myxococcaceae bacterium]